MLNSRKSTVLALLALSVLAGCAKDQSIIALQKKVTDATSMSVPEEKCGDLWSQFDTKPKDVEFVDCTVEKPQKIFSATYKVLGSKAGIIEDLLHKKYGMNKLHFVCCLWEPTDGKGGNFSSAGHTFSVKMSSGETVINDRTKWNDVPFFYVSVDDMSNI